MAPSPGARVHHPRMGPGVVRGVLDGGRTWLVAFDARPRAPFLLPAAEFEIATPRSGAKPAKPRAPTAAEIRKAAEEARRRQEEARMDALRHTPTGASPVDRQSIEALRLGVVPVRGLDRLTVGREEERAALNALFDAGRGMRVLSGGYGAGKTHFIELAESEALARGYLVARATFDPDETPPSHPLRIYGSLMEGLRYPEGPGQGLRPLLERLSTSEAHTTPKGARVHRWLSPAAWALHHLHDEDVVARLLDWVEGQTLDDASMLTDRLVRAGWTGARLLALPDYRTFGQIAAYLLGGIAVWARDAGWKGLVVLLDEAEYFDQLGATSKEMAENLLKYLAGATLPPEALAFDPGAVYRGGQAVHRAIPAVYDAEQPLMVLCAFTPNPQIDAALRRLLRRSDERIDLEALPARYFPLLADRVLGMFMEVYPGMDPPTPYRMAIRRALQLAYDAGEIGTTRQAARIVVEYWDLYRSDPDRAKSALRV